MPLSLLRDELAQRLDQERISQRFLAGPVNICTLMPMRSIPFKVVCLLGMNDGVYPRQLAPLGFDLMSQKPKHGDRSRRDDRPLPVPGSVNFRAAKLLYQLYRAFHSG
ncbi:hypothetical protein ACLBR5_08985 [Escherichia coli]